MVLLKTMQFIRLFHRKLVSASCHLSQYVQNNLFYLKMKLLGINIQLGKNISVGRMVRIRTTDGGKIILGDGVSLDDFVYLYAQRGCLYIDKNTYIGIGCQIVCIDSIKIGNNCLVAAYSVIRDANHGTAKGLLMTEQAQISGKIIIGNDVWLGSHVVVTAGCQIDNGAVIGANAVVTNNIPTDTIAAGVPARVIRLRE